MFRDAVALCTPSSLFERASCYARALWGLFYVRSISASLTYGRMGEYWVVVHQT